MAQRVISRRRQGAAMIEFVFVLPFLAFLLGLIFFFGFSMKNQQRVMTAARYESWRWVHPGDRGPQPWPDLNEMFFYGQASSFGGGHGQGPIESLEELTEATGEYRPKTYDLAQELLMEHAERGSRGSASAEFPSSVKMWERFRGSISAHSTREGHEWFRGQLNYLEPVRDNFLQELDDHIMGIDHHRLPENLRRLYLKRW